MLKTNLKRLRYQSDLTQKQIADLLGIDRSTYTYYETGRTRPDMNMLVKIAKIYKISCDSILGYSVDQKPESTAQAITEKSGYPIRRKEMSICDLKQDEQNLILLFRQFSKQEKEKIVNSAKGKMLTKKEKE